MRAFQTAAVERLGSTWLPDRVFEAGDIAMSPPSPYDVVSVSSGAAGAYDLAARHGSRSYRLAVQAVGKTMGEVGFAVEKADAAYLDHALTVDGFDCTPCRAEVSSPVIRDPDGGGWLVCTLTYTFTANPLE